MQEKPISNISESVAKQWKHEAICTGRHPQLPEQKVPSFNGLHASFGKSPVVSDHIIIIQMINHHPKVFFIFHVLWKQSFLCFFPFYLWKLDGLSFNS